MSGRTLRGSAAVQSRDVIVMIALAGLATVTAVRYIAAFRAGGERPVFYQETFGPAVMQACGRGFINPAPEQIPALDAFLAEKTDSFDCRAVPHDVAAIALTPMQDVSRYLLAASAMSFRMAGVRWQALDWLSAALYAATAAAFYLGLRLVTGPAVSAALAVLAIVSPLQLGNLPHIRDYSKAPFFVVSAAALVWIMTPRRAWSIYAVAVVIGLLMGIGVGFRTDVMLYLPPFVAGLLVCTPEASTSPWRVRAAACALCVGACVVIAWPILRVYSSGQGLWHMALLGLAPPFDHELGIRPALYGLGDRYLDQYVNAATSHYWMRVHHEPMSGASPMYAAASSEYYRRLFTTFPADFVTRAWAAVARSVDVAVDRDRVRAVPFGITAGWLSTVYWTRWWVLSWLQGAALPVAAALAIGLWARRRTAAVFFAGFIALSAGITSLQFQQRHYFHLEIVAYWIFAAAMGWLGTRPWKTAGIGRFPVWPSLLFALSLSAAIVLPVVALRSYQGRAVSAVLSGYESAPRLRVQAVEHESEGVAYLRMPALDPAEGAASTEMIVTGIRAGACRDGIDLTFRYAGEPGAKRDFTHSLHVDMGAFPGEAVSVLSPAYFTTLPTDGRVNFLGLELPERQRPCIESISRFADADAFPLLLTTVLPARWRNQPLYERLEHFE
jgi:hypothetical protein